MVYICENRGQDNFSRSSRFSGASVASFLSIKTTIKTTFYVNICSIRHFISGVSGLLEVGSSTLHPLIRRLSGVIKKYAVVFDQGVINIEFCKSVVQKLLASLEEITLTHRNISPSYANTCN